MPYAPSVYGYRGGCPVTAELGAPQEVHRIARRLQAAGHEAWAVGGGVRDALAGGHPVDWDFARRSPLPFWPGTVACPWLG